MAQTIMDFEVAVEKLNSMPIEDIIARANELPCVHVPKNTKYCIITNVLADLMGLEFGPTNGLSVGEFDVYYYPKDGGSTKEAWFNEAIKQLIRRFDRMPGNVVENYIPANEYFGNKVGGNIAKS